MSGGDIGNALQVRLKGDILSFPVKAAAVIYRGAPVAADSSGYAVMASDAAAMKFLGMAEEGNTAAEASSNGAVSAKVRRRGIFRMKLTGVAITDIGLRAYAETAQGAVGGNDYAVALAASSTYKNLVGTIVKLDATTHYCWVDIAPEYGVDMDITTHEAKVAQDAHTQNAIAPTVNAETSATPTINAAKFMGRLVTLANTTSSTFTLPSTGVTAGTVCRFVASAVSTGGMIITGGTLTGPQCASNVFTGCLNLGDSVDIECISANVYQVVALSQIRPLVGTDATGTVTLTASQFNSGLFLCKDTAGGTAVTLPTTGVAIDALCRIAHAHATAAMMTVTGGTLVGAQSAANVFTGCPSNGDSVLVQCVAANSYRILDVQQQRVTATVNSDTAVTAIEFLQGHVVCSKGTAQAVSLPATGVPVGTRCVIERSTNASAVTVSATAVIGGRSATNANAKADVVGDNITVECTGDDAYVVIAESCTN